MNTTRVIANQLDDGRILVAGAHDTTYAREIARATGIREGWGAIGEQLDGLPHRYWARPVDSNDPLTDLAFIPVHRDTLGAMPVLLWTT